MVTIHDIARKSGVSIATVSRVIHKSPNVLPETRAKVAAIIKELDYSPNKLAQNFRTQKTKNILVILPDIGNTFYTDIIAGIENVAFASGYYVLVVGSHGNPVLESRFFSMLSEKQVDGIITFSASLPLAEMEQYAEQYPIVVGCRYFDNTSLPNVTIDNEKASKDLVNYLLNLGHKKVCYLAAPSDILVYRDRLKGYLTALTTRNIPICQNLIINCDPNIQGGYDAIRKLLNSNVDFTAVVACGDTIAVGAIRGLSSFNLSVPKDCAVAGFDDIELSSLFSPSLTTVRQPQRQIGIRSAEQLLDLINGNKPASYNDVLNYELIIRESSGEYIG
ncbi:LacI family DNA-binding transcriptional regulator [Lacrimispora sp. 38-1]|uniref:LacI family DNA-binding transcriptional regulator n=1 Tax=Lacrimispora sp. 38-1 TaxID=3125778 RepID=UPI003CF07299